MPDPNPAALAFLSGRFSQSAKLFTAPAPDRDQLNQILAMALRVPDHGKLEPWRLIVLGPEDFSRLAAMAEARAHELDLGPDLVEKARGQFDRGILAVAVIASPKPSDKIPADEQFLSAGALCMNLVTVATAAGWGANWLSGWPSHDPAFRALAFDCSADERVAGIIHIATPKPGFTDRPRPDLEKIVSWGL